MRVPSSLSIASQYRASRPHSDILDSLARVSHAGAYRNLKLRIFLSVAYDVPHGALPCRGLAVERSEPTAYQRPLAVFTQPLRSVVRPTRIGSVLLARWRITVASCRMPSVTVRPLWTEPPARQHA